jgi:hypothetical protein
MTDEPRMTSEKPLYLAPKARTGNGLGYVNRPEAAMRGEPECIGPAILDGYAESNELRYSQRHALEVAQQRVTRRHLNTEDRIRDAERRAKHAHRNLTHEFHVLRQMLNRASKGGRKPPESALGKLERIEADLDGVS